MSGAVSDLSLITKNGDMVGYWQVDNDEPDSLRDAVAIRQASAHLTVIVSSLS